MCGRFVASTPRWELELSFGAEGVGPPDPGATYNAAPGTERHVVAEAPSGRQVGLMRWGLVAHWAESATRGPRPINLRGETIATKPGFADMLRRHRCLVPADGFYEFAVVADGRQPYLFRPATGSLVAMAAVWSRWRGSDGTTLASFAVVTTEANAEVAPVHHRMPVIVAHDRWDEWLSRDHDDLNHLRSLLVPAQDGSLTATAVSRRVNHSANDGADLLEPV